MSPIFSSSFNMVLSQGQKCAFCRCVVSFVWQGGSICWFIISLSFNCILWFHISAELTLDEAAPWAAPLGSYSRGPVFRCRPWDRLSWGFLVVQYFQEHAGLIPETKPCPVPDILFISLFPAYPSRECFIVRARNSVF